MTLKIRETKIVELTMEEMDMILFCRQLKFLPTKKGLVFLKKMKYVLQTDIKAVLTDNGSEFLAYFQKACEDEKIAHFFSRPRTPKDNPIAERFNKSLQQGFYWRCDLTQPLTSINKALADWLIEFNTVRPHESLSMRPPAAVYFSLFYKHRLTNPGVHLKLWNRTCSCFFLKNILSYLQ